MFMIGIVYLASSWYTLNKRLFSKLLIYLYKDYIMIGVTGILFTSIMIDEFPRTMVILYCTPPMIGIEFI